VFSLLAFNAFEPGILKARAALGCRLSARRTCAIGEAGHSEAETDRANFGHALRRKVAAEVLHPGEIGISFGRHAKSTNTAALTPRASCACRRPAPHVTDATALSPTPNSDSGLSKLKQLAADTHNSEATLQWFHFL
jgi:hypothetical protein